MGLKFFSLLFYYASWTSVRNYCPCTSQYKTNQGSCPAIFNIVLMHWELLFIFYFSLYLLVFGLIFPRYKSVEDGCQKHPSPPLPLKKRLKQYSGAEIVDYFPLCKSFPLASYSIFTWVPWDYTLVYVAWGHGHSHLHLPWIQQLCPGWDLESCSSREDHTLSIINKLFLSESLIAMCWRLIEGWFGWNMCHLSQAGRGLCNFPQCCSCTRTAWPWAYFCDYTAVQHTSTSKRLNIIILFSGHVICTFIKGLCQDLYVYRKSTSSTRCNGIVGLQVKNLTTSPPNISIKYSCTSMQITFTLASIPSETEEHYYKIK